MGKPRLPEFSNPALTVGEIVRSEEWALIEAVIAAELQRYLREVTNLDAFDPQLAQKVTALSAKIKALKDLNRRFYREAGIPEVEGEQSLTSGNLAG